MLQPECIDWLKNQLKMYHQPKEMINFKKKTDKLNDIRLDKIFNTL